MEYLNKNDGPILSGFASEYQDFICILQRAYLIQFWLHYNTAFQMHAAMGKSMSWQYVDKSIFNKFVSCQEPQNHVACFICDAKAHLANSCPQGIFRPRSEPTESLPTKATFNVRSTTCRQCILPNEEVMLVDFHTNVPLIAHTISHSNATRFNPLLDIAPSPVRYRTFEA